VKQFFEYGNIKGSNSSKKYCSDDCYKLRNYNINKEEYNQLFIEQKGCCAICDISQVDIKQRLCVDHCHITGLVRGLLCHNCNLGIGNLKDSVDLFKKTINYLNKASNNGNTR
jgi:hypothetical protein